MQQSTIEMVINTPEQSPATELLEIVADFIENHPDEFHMMKWRHDGSLLRRIGVRLGLCEPLDTVGCVACHTVRLGGGDIDGNIPAQAQRLLGITYEQANGLFYWQNWPEPYRTNFQWADKDTTSKAWIAAQRFRHFIDTGK